MFSAMIRMNPCKMNVGLLQTRLRYETYHKTKNLFVFFGDKAGILKMLEEQSWEFACHLPFTPPFIHNSDNW